MIVLIILYSIVAAVTLIVELSWVDVRDFVDFILVLPISVAGAIIWPVTILLFGLYYLVKE